MESTVINQAQENANQQPQLAPGGSNNTATGHHHADQHHEDPGHPQMQQQRFRSGGGQNPFFFDMDDPRDFFTNPALRTRLSRFQNPFNSMFGQRKRRTSPPPGTGGVGGGGGTPAGADPYHDDFFASHFDSPHWNNEPRGWPPMNGGRKRMQDHPSDRNNNQDMFNYIPEEFRQYMPEHVFQHRQAPNHQQQPQQPTNQAPHHAHPQQQQHQQPTYSQRSNSGDLRRPQFCDMGIQTDDIPQSGSGGNLSDHPQEPSHPQPHDTHHHHQQQQQSPNHPGSFARSSADVGVGNSPNGSFASANAYSSSGGGGAAGRDLGDGQRQTRSNSNSMGNVRRVPIIVEGGPSSFPKESYMPHRAPPTRQDAPPQPSPPARPPHPGPPPAREVPIQRPTEPPSPSVESINKIQDIQQDVLDLMFKVEQYKGGNKNDKEYKYLDEMLTRNLLKLDTIDTRGNDSIRLARKEAIKCIQASLSVLEAKVGEGKEAPAESSATDEADSAEKIEAEAAKEATESPVIDKSKIAIPLPPIPGQVPPPTIRDCNSDEEDGEVAPTYVSEKKVELKTNK